MAHGEDRDRETDRAATVICANLSSHAATHALAVGVMAVGCALQAALGTGLALFVVPILALIDPGFVPGPMLLAGTVLAAVMAYRERGALDRDGLRASLAGLVVGTAVGALTLFAVSGIDLRRVFGGVIVAAVLISTFGPPIAATGWTLVVGGFASGVMGTMAGIHGPAITLVFQNAEPRVARSMLGAFFVVAYPAAIAMLALFGLFGLCELERTIVLLPGVGLGLVLAPLVKTFVDRRRLRIIMLTTALVSGIILIVR